MESVRLITNLFRSTGEEGASTCRGRTMNSNSGSQGKHPQIDLQATLSFKICLANGCDW